MRHVLSALVQNQPGVLAHISGMMSSRGFNIDSLAVGETEDQLLSRMTFVVSGDDVTRPKPDPEPYVTAARLLGVDVADCVAVEDSHAGVASAVASGARVVAVEVMQALAPRPGLSRVASLADLTVPDFARIAGGDVLDLRRAS